MPLRGWLWPVYTPASVSCVGERPSNRLSPTSRTPPGSDPGVSLPSAGVSSCYSCYDLRIVSEGDDRIIYIREAAGLLNRQMTTLRKWDQTNVLPVHLRPKRGSRDWRYWTEEQIEGIKEWIRKTDRRSGKGLSHYHPTEKQLDNVLTKLRKPRTSVNRRIEEMDIG